MIKSLKGLSDINLNSMVSIIQKMEGQKILIIGDVMIDSYLWGKIERISPEAPVPIVNVETTENRLGGAANVALNVKSLGAVPILLSISGSDDRSELFLQLMKDAALNSDHIIKDTNRPTTQKTRVIARNKHVLRFDSESVAPIHAELESVIIKKVERICSMQTVGAAILQDYNKGILTASLIDALVKIFRKRKIPIAVDPKKLNFMSFKNVNLFKPNLKELREGLGIDIDADQKPSLDAAALKLRSKIAFRQLLLTLSERGVYFMNEDGVGEILPAQVRRITDVSGAGDTVISVAAAAMAAAAPLRDIAWLSNLAGGLVCEKSGVAPVDKAALLVACEG